MFKKIIFSVLVLFSLTLQAAELSTFSEIAKAVEQGSELVFVVSLKSCHADFPLADLTVSVKPNAFMLIADKRVTASDKHFTLNHPRFRGSPVIDYGKYTINADGSVELEITVMDARTYHRLSTSKLNCDLGTGFKVFNSI